MCARRSKTIHFLSGEMSTDIQVPSVVSKSMSRVFPRARVVSHFSAGFSFCFSLPSSRGHAAGGSDARERTKSGNVRKTGRIAIIESLPKLMRVCNQKARQVTALEQRQARDNKLFVERNHKLKCCLN